MLKNKINKIVCSFDTGGKLSVLERQTFLSQSALESRNGDLFQTATNCAMGARLIIWTKIVLRLLRRAKSSVGYNPDSDFWWCLRWHHQTSGSVLIWPISPASALG
jgi:hypothetical protein